jgi:hypothetical protein
VRYLTSLAFSPIYMEFSFFIQTRARTCAQILKAVSPFLYDGMKVPDRLTKGTHENFAFRLKTGDYEVEIDGNYEEVLNTIKNLPNLVVDIDKAFDKIKPKKIATLTVKTENASPQKASKQYPQIQSSGKLNEAVLRILETDWGKWRPRTLDELDEALKANGLEQSLRALGGALMDLVKKGRIRRWNTNAGYVYILAEKEALHAKGEVE